MSGTRFSGGNCENDSGDGPAFPPALILVPTGEEDAQNGQNGEEHDPDFEPIISLPIVAISTNEENEEELLKLRARLYRFVEHEWKERGTGEIKLLRHIETNAVRVVMRRDKTLKICANHYITPDVIMNPHCNSDKQFNWSVFADFADEEVKSELFAIRFANIENARIWQTKFEEAKEIVSSKCSLYNGQDETHKDSDSDSDSDSWSTLSPNLSIDKGGLVETISETKQATGADTADVAQKLEMLAVKDEISENEK